METPNINLRVYRRDTNDMTLIYNGAELSNDLKYSPVVTINGQEITYFVDDNEDSKVKDSARGDIFVLIPYFENKLNDSEKYLVKLTFGKDVFVIEVEPKGVFPALKDNLKMFSQVLGYDKTIHKWIKLPLVRQKEKDNYHLSVADTESQSILSEILDTLKSIDTKLK